MVTRVLNPASSLPTAPPEGFRPGFTAMGTLPYPSILADRRPSFGGRLEVPTIIGAATLDW